MVWFFVNLFSDRLLAFTWSTSRGSAHIDTKFKGFEGTLLTDGYGAYDRNARNKPGITQAQCWAHTRRYYVKAEGIKPETVALALTDRMGTLSKIEEGLRERQADVEHVLKRRSRKSKHLVEAFFGSYHKFSVQRFQHFSNGSLAFISRMAARHGPAVSIAPPPGHLAVV